MIKSDRSWIVVLAAVGLFGVIFGAAMTSFAVSNPDIVDWVSYFEELLYRYQTLLAGVGAIAVAALSVAKITDQISLQREQAISDKRFALRQELAALRECEELCRTLLEADVKSGADPYALSYAVTLAEQYGSHLPFTAARTLGTIGRLGGKIERYGYSNKFEKIEIVVLSSLFVDLRTNVQLLVLQIEMARDDLERFLI